MTYAATFNQPVECWKMSLRYTFRLPPDLDGIVMAKLFSLYFPSASFRNDIVSSTRFETLPGLVLDNHIRSFLVSPDSAHDQRGSEMGWFEFGVSSMFSGAFGAAIPWDVAPAHSCGDGAGHEVEYAVFKDPGRSQPVNSSYSLTTRCTCSAV